MGGRTHMSFGALSFAVAAGPLSLMHVSPIAAGAGVCVGAVAGLLPDIDEPNALLGRGTWVPKALGPLVRALGVIICFPFRVLGVVIKGVLGHRGGTHSLAMSLFFTLCFAIPLTSFFGAAADWIILTIWFGYLSHLFADMLNPSGVPLFWPLYSKHKTWHVLPEFLRIPTESPPNAREVLIRTGVIAVTAVICIVYFALPVLEKL